MDVFSIDTVVWQDSGDIVAYDAENNILMKLTLKGLEDLRKVHDEFVFLDDRKKAPDPLPPLPKGSNGVPKIGVRVMSDSEVDRKDCPKTIDGVKLQPGDKVLLVAQQNPLHNGVHQVKLIGANHNGARIKLIQIPTEVQGTIVFVEEGLFHEQKLYTLQGDDWLELSASGGSG